MVVDHTDAEEQHARDDTMAEHLNRRPGQRGHTKGIERPMGKVNRSSRRSHAQQHYPHVAHAGVGDQLLHIRLHEADARAIDNIDHRKYAQRGSEFMRAKRQEGKANTN